MDDEFLRWQAELAGLEAEPPAAADGAAPSEPPPPAPALVPSVKPKVVSAVISRPAVTQPAGPAPPDEYEAYGGAGGAAASWGYFPGQVRSPGARARASAAAGAPALTRGPSTLQHAFPPGMPPPPAGYGQQPAAPVPQMSRLPPGNVLQQGAPRAFVPPPGQQLVHVREAAGDKWVDASLSEWPENDHRIFVGDLGKEVGDEVLSRAFRHYPSFLKAKAVKNVKTGEPKGYGFVSFGAIGDMVKALKEMDGKYIGNRPCKLKKSTWDTREAGVAVVPAAKAAAGGAGTFKPGNKRRHISTLSGRQ